MAERQATAAAPAQDGKAPEAAPRKIIKNASLSVEAGSVKAARDGAIQATERTGGYVASSSEHQSGDDGVTSISLTLKVPSEKLGEALLALRGLGTKTIHESVTSQDVSAEFYDTEARLKAQRAIEAQLIEIAKEAKTVPDLLAVQRQLGEVRGEIERMEGRRNQLEHQTSLSTIQLTLHQEAGAASLVSTLASAGRDARAVSAGLLHGGIRLLGVLGPLALFFGPLVLGLLHLARRLRRRTAGA